MLCCLKCYDGLNRAVIVFLKVVQPMNAIGEGRRLERGGGEHERGSYPLS